jgi:hypothetical protein
MLEENIHDAYTTLSRGETDQWLDGSAAVSRLAAFAVSQFEDAIADILCPAALPCVGLGVTIVTPSFCLLFLFLLFLF